MFKKSLFVFFNVSLKNTKSDFSSCDYHVTCKKIENFLYVKRIYSTVTLIKPFLSLIKSNFIGILNLSDYNVCVFENEKNNFIKIKF